LTTGRNNGDYSQALILDGPKAASDARAEYEVFKRFSELVAGRMAVVISHRFSTVRMADRIIVLKNGVIEDEGTHACLLARGGLYADLFTLQADGYPSPLIRRQLLPGYHLFGRSGRRTFGDVSPYWSDEAEEEAQTAMTY
jgi:ABC-type transport system involved in cytochrome bd biosynthesis fused ATPase/permease subunit